jgi:hypothetical protein
MSDKDDGAIQDGLPRAAHGVDAASLRFIQRPALRAERRIRLGRALDWGTSGLCVALVLAAVVLVLRKTHHVGEHAARIALVLAALETLLVATVAYLRPLPRRIGAIALDRHHKLSDRLSSALSFAELPPAERTAFMDAAIDDAVKLGAGLDPRRATPIKRPRDSVAAVGLLLATVAIALFEVRTHKPVLAARTIDAVDVTADDLDAMRDFLKEVEQREQSDETKAAIQEFNQLIEDLAARRLDRTEAFRKMQALEDRLMEGREADHKALEEALQKIGEEMKKADLTKPAGDALDNKDLALADKALRDLAKKLRENKPDKAQLDKMREALKKASEDSSQRQAEIAKRREELEKQLLTQKQNQPDGGQSEQEKSLLQKRERELERLNREQEQQASTQRQLDRLDRELAQAAEDLMKDLGAAAKDLEQGAEDINRMAKQEMTDQEKQELKQKIDELREMLRQQGQGGQQQMVRLRRFQSHARGQSGRGGQQGQGQQGQGQEGQGQEGQGGQQGQGQQGQGQQGQNGQGQGQQGQGQQGQGQGQQGQGQQGQGQAQQGQGQGGQGGQGGQQPGGSGGETWVLGPGGEKILMISQGHGQGGQGQGQGQQGQGQNGGQGDGPPNPHGWGTGHDAHVQGGATHPKVGTQDSQIAGQDTGQGGSRSEVIQGAAERGFASRHYTKVYREYHQVAEEALNKDEIPGGYRFYVKRYFQLIRPREE